MEYLLMQNHEKEPVPEISEETNALNKRTETQENTSDVNEQTKWIREAVVSIKEPFRYTIEFVFIITLFSFVVDKISPLPIITSLVGIGVPFLIGFALLLQTFWGLTLFKKKVFTEIKSRALFFLATTFLGMIATILLWLFFKDEIAPLKPIQIFASGLNYAVVFVYTVITLFTSAGFANNKHVESWFLRFVSICVIVVSFCLYYNGITYSEYGSIVKNIALGSVLVVLSAKFGIYLCIREEAENNTILKSINNVRLKARENKFNEVFFAAVGLIVVMPIFIWLAWIAHDSDYDTVKFICYEVDNFSSSLGQFRNDCVHLGYIK